MHTNSSTKKKNFTSNIEEARVHIIYVQIYVVYSQIEHILLLGSHTNMQLLGAFFRIKNTHTYDQSESYKWPEGMTKKKPVQHNIISNVLQNRK